MWDHPVSSASISRDYARTLLEKRNNKVTPGVTQAAESDAHTKRTGTQHLLISNKHKIQLRLVRMAVVEL